MATDRLSDLPHDLLQHILSFAPAREAAASAILSRQWRPLWRRTSAVNLDTRPYLPANSKGEHHRLRSSPLDAFFYDALAALAAVPRRTPLKRLTLYLVLDGSTNGGADYAEPRDGHMVANILAADSATAQLEELIIGCRYDSPKYGLPLASMTCAATLRVLELEQCKLQPPSAPSLAFPRLTDLRLRNCFFMEGYLQAMVDAAPALTSLLLINVAQKPLEPLDPADDILYYDMPTYRRLPLRLRCLTGTVLELEAYPQKHELQAYGHIGIQLDMPSLRSFRYHGRSLKLSLISPAPGLARVDVDATYKGDLPWSLYEPMPPMLTSFSTTRALKLTISAIKDILDGEKEHGGVILPTFPNLKLLHLDVIHEHESSSSMALSMARLLRSCPAMSELRLMMWWNYNYLLEGENKDPGTTPFAQSMDRFEMLASKASSRSNSKVSELPAALSDNCASFTGLQTSLRKVTLLFNTKEVDCFQVQLAKFLVENAMVLEEMHIDDGNQFWPEHIRHKLARWRAESFRARNLPDTAGFQVHQLNLW
ncbi:hypothetical protein QYE76_021241 [Lolium multiflorum]|uniref:F-box domain-containing protein n=1 Tax=Lolium multiflorum TaxID=4521 RepID=A0AAD8VQR0_LOLMU|nr:hypothetical protein QYE76_021241 [Lolium multiflorum]